VKANHCITNILDLSAVCCRVQAGGSRGKLIVHLDNAELHILAIAQQFLEQKAMEKTCHLAYSPDFALSDFCLFSYLKQPVAGQKFPDGGRWVDGLMR
jgi:hypothetical protein